MDYWDGLLATNSRARGTSEQRPGLELASALGEMEATGNLTVLQPGRRKEQVAVILHR